MRSTDSGGPRSEAEDVRKSLGESLTDPLVAPPEGLERLPTRLGVLAFFLVLAAMETSKELLTARLSGVDRTVTDAILVNGPWWLFWALATPVVVALARRFPLDRPGRPGSFAIHALAGALLSLLHLTGVAALVYFTVVRGGDYVTGSLPAQIRFWVEGYGVLDFFVYWMLIGGYHALLYHRRYTLGRLREEEARTRAARLEGAATEARLRALRAELDPHFLFNTLNAVAGLVRSGRGGDATTVLARLSTLLRATLERGRERVVPLHEELDLARRYLDIEEIRLGERLETSVSAGDAPPAALVPPLILQPLVENAVRHGVATLPGPARVDVEARTRSGTLVLEVRDTGPGPGEGAVRPGARGLRNVRERLETLYGGQADLVLESDGEGCTARVSLPLEATRAADTAGPGPDGAPAASVEAEAPPGHLSRAGRT